MEISVLDVLRENGLGGLLLVRAPFVASPRISGNPLHLNDVEVFPKRLEPGYFKPGDIMISLRDVHSVLVFDPRTLRLKFKSVGQLVAQHDPDFVDGNTISVFDNNNVAPTSKRGSSRIVRISMPGNRLTVAFEGTAEHPFFTYKMGKQQLLPNGDLLLTESFGGRAIEVAPDGEIVWQYVNRIGPSQVGLVEEVQRLPLSAGDPFRGKQRTACPEAAP